MKAVSFGVLALTAAMVATPAMAQGRLVHRETDKHTGAMIQIFKTTEGGRIEVDAPSVRISKSVAGTKTVTRLTGGGDELLISIDERVVSAASGKTRASATRSDGSGLDRVRAVVSASAIGRRAAALIGQLGFGAGTPAQPMLLTTRAFILSAAGVAATLRGEAQWVLEARRRLAPAAMVTKVAWAQKESDGASKGMTPTDCWNAYAKEAIEAYMEYEDCMANLKWYDFFGKDRCGIIYDLRAIGAFTWWMKCVALN